MIPEVRIGVLFAFFSVFVMCPAQALQRYAITEGAPYTSGPNADDEIWIYHNGNLIYYKLLNDNPSPPVTFWGAPGDTIRVVGNNLWPVNAFIPDIYIYHYSSDQRVLLMPRYSGRGDQICIFFDKTTTIPVFGSGAYVDSLGISSEVIGDPISPKGNFFLPMTDMFCSSRGPDLKIARIYNSASVDSKTLGFGWHHAYLSEIGMEGGYVYLTREDAKKEVYCMTNGKYVIQDDQYSGDLTQTTNGWQYVDLKNNKWLYCTNGKLESVQDRNANTLTMNWSGGGLLTNVVDSIGRALTLNYSGDGLLTNVTDWAGRRVEYGYTNVGGLSCLAEVRDVRGFKTVYGYGADGLLTTVTDANGRRTVENVYDDRQRVVSQTDAFTNRTEIAY